MTLPMPYAVRPIAATDKIALERFHARLGADSRYRRYHGAKGDLTHQDLAYLTEVDNVAHVAMVCVDSEGEIASVARVAAGGDQGAEIATVVADDSRGHGLGMRASQAALERFWTLRTDAVLAYIQHDNTPAFKLFCQRLHGRRVANDDCGIVTVRIDAPAETALPEPCAALAVAA